MKHCNDSNAFNGCSNTMHDVYEDTDYYNPNRKRKILTVFDDMVAYIMTNKTFQAIIKELFIRCRKLNNWLVFTAQSYFSVPKDVRLNSIQNYELQNMQNYKITRLIILQVSTLKILWRFTENAQKNHIIFGQLILR